MIYNNKKKLLPVFQSCCALLVIFSCCSKIKHDRTDEEHERAVARSNKLKSRTEYKIIFRLGIPQKKTVSYEKFYDINGFNIRENAYNPDGSIDFKLLHEYDAAGNLVRIKAWNGDSSVLFTETRSYDDNNNRKELYFYLPDGTYKYRNTATYDDAGRISELKWYWPTGFKSINRYKYDGRNKTSDEEYDSHGDFSYQWRFTYDQQGNLEEAIQYYAGNIMNSKIKYEYNPHNLLTKQVNYFGESIQSTLELRYNERNLLISKTQSGSNNKVTTEYSYEYAFY